MVLDARLEGGRFPQLEWFGRLDVVMAVNQEMPAPPRGGGPPCRRVRHDDRVAVGRAEPRVQADGLAMLDQPTGGGLEVFAVMALGGDAGEAQVIAKLEHESRLVFLEVIQHVLHEWSGLKQKGGKGEAGKWGMRNP